jgi:hypothetical protein
MALNRSDVYQRSYKNIGFMTKISMTEIFKVNPEIKLHDDIVLTPITKCRNCEDFDLRLTINYGFDESPPIKCSSV